MAELSRRTPTLGGLPLKHISLVTLTVQNSALILIMHYSRIMPTVGGQRYFTSTAVFLNEVIKLAISLSMALYDISSTVPPSSPATTILSTLSSAVFTGDSWKLAIPAMLYTLQNSLQYLAVSNLEAATFQVTYQLKILTTALFSIVLLGRSLSGRRWISLLLLATGVAIVQIPTTKDPADVSNVKGLENTQASFFWPRSFHDVRQFGNVAAARLIKRSATYDGIDQDVAMQDPQMNASLGLAAAVVACILSGLAGVYFEKVLKDRSGNQNTSLWVRNVQLSFYSLFPALFIGVLFKDGENIAKHGFFSGYNYVVWTAVVFQALGGVIVASVIHYADNIAKNFATSISIVLSVLGSVVFFGFSVSINYLIGTSIVLAATYLYNSKSERSRPPPIRIADYEKTTITGTPSYYDEPTATMPKSPLLKGEAHSTSRPGTPTAERRFFLKRDD
ncbi:MAG: hypothetical protein M1820_000399 [Bogoriella megaspora]|nr:MAG: hypothetical protein M1820_000399 [Bogoriella megaspora]